VKKLILNSKKSNELIDWDKLGQFLNKYRFDEALKFIWERISETDHYLDKTKPWALKEKKLNLVLSD